MSIIIARYRFKKVGQQLDRAVYRGEYSERPIDYIHDHIESIWGIERRMSDVEIESYRRIGHQTGFPEIGTVEKSRIRNPDESWENYESRDDKDWITYWDMYFEASPKPAPGSFSGWTLAPINNPLYKGAEWERPEWRDDSSSPGPSFSAIFHRGQDTGMRVLVEKGQTRLNTPNIDQFVIFRVTDCMIYDQPPEYERYALHKQPFEIKIQPHIELARALFHQNRWHPLKTE